MSKKDGFPSVQYTIIWIGLLVGLGFYAADIIIDVFVFGEGTLIEEADPITDTVNPLL